MFGYLRFFSKTLLHSTTKKVIFILFILGNIIFFNSFNNAFVFDDILQIVNNPTIHTLFSIPSLFLDSTKLFFPTGDYRPIPNTVYTILYFLFQNNTFFYHYLQTVIHIANSILIFLIFKKYIKSSIAFFLSILFLVHPINEETVVYIANLQDSLFVFFGLLSFYFLQKGSIKLKEIIISSIFLFFSLLSKESAALFFISNYLFIFLYKKTKLFLYSFFSLLVGVAYFLLRLHFHVPTKEPVTPIMSTSLIQRLISIPSILFFYIKDFFFPKDLIGINSWIVKSIEWNTFYIPLLFDMVFIFLLLAGSVVVYKKTREKKILFFFLAWFLLGILLHIQLIPLDFTVADHYFYFPIIGLLALIGLFLQKIPATKITRISGVTLAIILIIILSARTIVRNNDWKNDLTLFSHDEPLSKNDFSQELSYGNALVEVGRDNEAVIHMQNAVQLYPQSYRAWNNLGLLYYKKGDIENAKKAWEQSIIAGRPYNEFYGTYENMSSLLLKYGKQNEAVIFIRRANILYPTDATLWGDRVVAEYKANNYEGALTAAKYYYLLQKDAKSYELYTLLLKRLGP